MKAPKGIKCDKCKLERFSVYWSEKLKMWECVDCTSYLRDSELDKKGEKVGKKHCYV